MPTPSLSDRLIAPLRRLAAARDPLPQTDGQLLTAFVSTHDPTAFEAIVRRHGPMVFGVCRRVVGDPHTAEDAFQAVFVVLARRAGAVRPREQLANFLFGVAHRTALKARGQLARRRSREKQVDAMPEPATPPPAVWDDVQPVIDDELAALPDKLRFPMILCDLEGRTQRDVARQLKLPPATLANRLAAARRKLAERLAARGVTLAGGALATVLSANAATAAVGPTLVRAATSGGLAAVGSGAGVIPANVLQLSEGVVRMLAYSKLKLVTATVLAGLVLLSGAGVGLVKADEQPTKPAAKLRPDLSDAEYLKRVCESLRGSPATPAEIGYFVADPDAAKRKKVVTWLTEEPKADASVRVFLADKWSRLKLRQLGSVADFRQSALELTAPTKGDVFVNDLTARIELVDPVADTLPTTAAWDARVLEGVDADQPLRTWAVDFTSKITTVPDETDDAFLNRVIEAARGGKPTRLEKEYFAADKDAKKREKLLDLILSDKATAKKLGPDWKQQMLTPPQRYTWVYFVTDGAPWAAKLIDELLVAKKTDEQILESLTLAATGRLPTDAEKKLAAAMVAKQKDKKAAWQEVAGTLSGTDEAKKHAERLKPQANEGLYRWHVQPSQVKPVEKK